MGRFSVEIELVNFVDQARAEAGDIARSEVRSLRMQAVVDSGAAPLVLPASVVEQLGVKTAGKAAVRYADGRCAERLVAEGVSLAYAGRASVFSAVVEPGRDSALLGAIVLEELDLVVDCKRKALVPRDPDRIIFEVE